DNLLSWSTKRQHTISRSSAEAEYRGVANVVAETAWIRNLLHELHSPLLTATLEVPLSTVHEARDANVEPSKYGSNNVIECETTTTIIDTFEGSPAHATMTNEDNPSDIHKEALKVMKEFATKEVVMMEVDMKEGDMREVDVKEVVMDEEDTKEAYVKKDDMKES
ncbi:ribonuclease H-like domain-containing protein, partial [Tanacetum coccineum]